MKKLLFIIIFFVTTLLMLPIFINSEYGQKLIISNLKSKLSKSGDLIVNIDRVTFSLPYNIHIDNLSITKPTNTQILLADNIDFKINFIGLNKIGIKDLTANDIILYNKKISLYATLDFGYFNNIINFEKLKITDQEFVIKNYTNNKSNNLTIDLDNQYINAILFYEIKNAINNIYFQNGVISLKGLFNNIKINNYLIADLAKSDFFQENQIDLSIIIKNKLNINLFNLNKIIGFSEIESFYHNKSNNNYPLIRINGDINIENKQDKKNKEKILANINNGKIFVNNNEIGWFDLFIDNQDHNNNKGNLKLDNFKLDNLKSLLPKIKDGIISSNIQFNQTEKDKVKLQFAIKSNNIIYDNIVINEASIASKDIKLYLAQNHDDIYRKILSIIYQSDAKIKDIYLDNKLIINEIDLKTINRKINGTINHNLLVNQLNIDLQNTLNHKIKFNSKLSDLNKSFAKISFYDDWGNIFVKFNNDKIQTNFDNITIFGGKINGSSLIDTANENIIYDNKFEITNMQMGLFNTHLSAFKLNAAIDNHNKNHIYHLNSKINLINQNIVSGNISSSNIHNINKININSNINKNHSNISANILNIHDNIISKIKFSSKGNILKINNLLSNDNKIDNKINGYIKIIEDINIANIITQTENHKIDDGIISSGGNMNIAGSFKKPILSGKINFANVKYYYNNIGLLLNDVNFNLIFKGSKIFLDNFIAKDNNDNQLDIKGFYDIGNQKIFTGNIISKNNINKFNFNINSEKFNFLNNDLLSGIGKIKANVKGSLDEVLVKADVKIDDGKINIETSLEDNNLPEQLNIVDKLYHQQYVANNKDQDNKKLNSIISSNINLDIDINADNNIYVVGSGINVNLDGKINISGALDNPIFKGNLKATKGKYFIFGKNLNINQASLKLNGDFNKGYLNAEAVDNLKTKDQEYKLIFNLQGALDNLELSIKSEPSLSDDNIISLILFNSLKDNISNAQALQLAINSTILKNSKSKFFDRLDFSEEKDKDGSSKTNIRIGKKLTKNIFIEMATGFETVFRVELQITPKLSLETILRPEDPNSFAINWHFDY